MAGKKDAEYWRNYRANKAKEVEEPQAAIPGIVEKAQALPKISGGLRCDCVPGDTCMGHAIARAQVRAIDAILDGVKTGRPDSWLKFQQKH